MHHQFKPYVAVALFLITLPAFAVETVDLAQGYCADPSFTDEARAEIISRSMEDAVACMGEDWVSDGDGQLIKKTKLGDLEIEADVSRNHLRITNRDGGGHVFLISSGRLGQRTQQGEFTGPFRLTDRDATPPYGIFYQGGFGIYGTHQTKDLGQSVTHGGIRLYIPDAKIVLRSGSQTKRRERSYSHSRLASVTDVWICP